MITQDVVAGIQLLDKYRSTKSGYDIGAEHDVIYCYATPRSLSDEDVAEMVKLGWHQDVEWEGEDFELCDYDPDESWCVYVYGFVTQLSHSKKISTPVERQC